MIVKNLKHFIWDFDGTLLDTYPNITGYLKRALNDFGHDADKTEIRRKMMITIPYTIDYYSNLYSLPELRDRYREYYKNEKDDPVRVFDGVREVLKRIRENGGTSYIFTNRGNDIYALLERVGMTDEFAEIITADSPHFKIKPAPDAILYIMEKYGADPENTVMIGDRECDLGSGYNAGCKTIHLFTPEAPEYPRCNWRINNFYEMLDML